MPEYFRLVSPNTEFSSRGMGFQIREVLTPHPLNPKEQEEIERLREAGIEHLDPNPHLALTNPRFTRQRRGAHVLATFDATPTDYLTHRALGRPGSAELPPQAQAVGTGIVLVTKDGYSLHSNRDKRNGRYPGYKDASANGTFSVNGSSIQPRETITDLAIENVFHEVEEELCIPKDALQQSITEGETVIVPLGVVKDERSPHLNIAFGGRLGFTLDQIRQFQKDAEEDNATRVTDFSDLVDGIKASPREIRRLLLNREHVFTPSAIGNFLLAGSKLRYDMVKDKVKIEPIARISAIAWRWATRVSIERRYRRLDRQVRRNHRNDETLRYSVDRPDKPKEMWTTGLDSDFSPEVQLVTGK